MMGAMSSPLSHPPSKEMATKLESDAAKADGIDEGGSCQAQAAPSDDAQDVHVTSKAASVVATTTAATTTTRHKPASSPDLSSQAQTQAQAQVASLHGHSHSDCEQSQSSTATSWDLHKKEDRRSSFRQPNTKQRTQHSPRWRDQEEQQLHIQASASLEFHLSELQGDGFCHHGKLQSAININRHDRHLEHNDSASQTSHTYSDAQSAYSHHSSYNEPDCNDLNFNSHGHMHHNKGHLNGCNINDHDPMIHNETRFPTAMGYAASEAAKSDIATVCSGSVIEDIDRDIDMASVASGEFIAHSHSSSGPNPGSAGGGFVLKQRSSLGSATAGSGHHLIVQNHPNNTLMQQSNRRGVEFASHTHTYPFHQNAPSHHLLSEEISRDMLAATSAMNSSNNNNNSSNSDNNNPHDNNNMNDMGPPLSRTLLLAATAAASEIMNHHHHQGPNSHPGSVRSFSTGEAPSDVVAHVDTDDCGGSMSEVSQEEESIHKLEMSRELLSHDDANCNVTGAVTTEIEPQNLGDVTQKIRESVLVANTTNGRVSPGGTIYKGKGVRRYQGRYMKLPLKRFHQGEFNETVVQNPLAEGEDLYGDSDNDIPAQPPPFDDWSNSGYRSLSRSFSRSISPPPSRSRSRSRSESPRDNIRRRRPSWSPHRGSDRKNRPIKNNIQRSPSRSPSPPVRNDRPANIPRSHSPPHRTDDREDEGKWRRRQSPTRNVQIREREGNDGRWRRDRWNNERQMKSRSRSRSRSGGPRRSPMRGRKRKGHRSSRSKS